MGGDVFVVRLNIGTVEPSAGAITRRRSALA